MLIYYNEYIIRLKVYWKSNPGFGIEPMSPALAGSILTTGPRGKSPDILHDWIIQRGYQKGQPKWKCSKSMNCDNRDSERGIKTRMELWKNSWLGECWHCCRLRDFTQSEESAAAKSLQSCPTLCDPIDVSPRGAPVPGILQARTLEWVAISFSNAGKWKVRVKSLSRVRLLATPWTAAHQAPPSMGFSRQEYGSGVPLPSP